MPATAGLSIPLNTELDVDSIAANGYYVFTTDWSLGTYVGGGFGKFNLGEDPLLIRRCRVETSAIKAWRV